MKIVVSTKNNHKVQELKKMLNMPGIELYTMADYGIDLDIEENGTTFEENAMIKAKSLYKALNQRELVVIADDSGLCVDALNGQPGIYSARYSGGDSKENNKKLLNELKNTKPLERGAHFVCSIAVVTDGIERVFTGKCYGLIDKEERGENGFGYDPLFYFPATQKTFGEMTAEEKDKVSHRANAVSKLKEWLKDINH